MSLFRRGRLLVLTLATLLPAPSSAQRSPDAIVLPGSPTDDRDRLDQGLGRASSDGYLMRSSVDRTLLNSGPDEVPLRLLLPGIHGRYNSQIPYAWNAGGITPGRGWATSVTGGVALSAGRFAATIAPTVSFTENRAFSTLTEPSLPGQSVYAAPWYRERISADLPLRFGNRSHFAVTSGESALVYRGDGWVGGLSTATQWWGPSWQNALLISSNAPGFPRAFLSTRHPLRTGIGSIEAKWIIGGLSPSLYFDAPTDEGVRSLSGAIVLLRPSFDPHLTFGAGRVVYGSAGTLGGVVEDALDVFWRWRAGPDSVSATAGSRSEQLLSLFGRALYPEAGIDAWAEWSRLELPGSLREFLLDPGRTRAYTLGLQWSGSTSSTRAVRITGELTDLEEGGSYSNGPARPYYTSPVIGPGYTHRGRVIGAAIGPGGSSQWLEVEHVAPSWRAGIFGTRMRWANDAYYIHGPGAEPSYLAHDVSLAVGLRTGVRIGAYEIVARASRGKRYNYLFQNPLMGIEGEGAVDVVNTTLDLMVVPY